MELDHVSLRKSIPLQEMRVANNQNCHRKTVAEITWNIEAQLCGLRMDWVQSFLSLTLLCAHETAPQYLQELNSPRTHLSQDASNLELMKMLKNLQQRKPNIIRNKVIPHSCNHPQSSLTDEGFTQQKIYPLFHPHTLSWCNEQVFLCTRSQSVLWKWTWTLTKLGKQQPTKATDKLFQQNCFFASAAFTRQQLHKNSSSSKCSSHQYLNSRKLYICAAPVLFPLPQFTQHKPW